MVAERVLRTREAGDFRTSGQYPHYMLLEPNLLCMAVTRGKTLVVIIGQRKAMAMAVKRLGSVKRLTNLQHRLQHIARGQDREF